MSPVKPTNESQEIKIELEIIIIITTKSCQVSNPHLPALQSVLLASQMIELLQKGGPLPGPESGLLSNTQNELSEVTHVLTKQEILLGKSAWVESSRLEPRRTALPR